MKRYGRSFASGCLAALAGLGVLAVQAQAQTYPTRSITMIVPVAAGGPTDVIARIVTGHMAQTLGQSIIIENVVGAGGTTATPRAARDNTHAYQSPFVSSPSTDSFRIRSRDDKSAHPRRADGILSAAKGNL